MEQKNNSVAGKLQTEEETQDLKEKYEKDINQKIEEIKKLKARVDGYKIVFDRYEEELISTKEELEKSEKTNQKLARAISNVKSARADIAVVSATVVIYVAFIFLILLIAFFSFRLMKKVLRLIKNLFKRKVNIHLYNNNIS